LLSAWLAAQTAPAEQAATAVRAPTLAVSVGHSGEPNHAAFAGRFLLTATRSNLAFIDLATGLTVERLSQGSLVMTIEPSPAGDLVAVGTCGRTIHVYDANTRALVRRLATRQECVHSISFTTDGALLAGDNSGCCKNGGGVQVWDMRTGDVVREFTGMASVRHVAFGADRWLAAVDLTGKLTIFEWPSGRSVRTIDGLPDPGPYESKLLARRDGRYLVWHPVAGMPRVWDMESGEELRPPDKPRRFPTAAEFLDDGRLAYIDSDQMFVMTLPGGPTETRGLASTALVNDDVVLSRPDSWLRIRRDGLMAAGKRDSATLAWDATGSRLRDVKSPSLVSPESLQWTRTGLIAFADGESGPRGWSDRLGTPVDFGTAIRGADSLAFRPDGARVAVAGFDSMYVLNVERRRPVSARTRPLAGDPGVAYSPDGSRLAFQSPSGFWLFDGTLRPLRRIATLGQYVGVDRVAFSGDSRWIAASLGGPSPTLAVWPAAEAGASVTLDLEKVTYAHDGRALGFSHDSKWLASFRTGSSLTVWSTASWTIERTWMLAGTGRALAFAPADSRLAIAADGEAAIWDAADGRKLMTLDSPGSPRTEEIAWSPDGRRVVTSADDGVLRLWMAADGRLLASLYFFGSGREWLLVTPDGRLDGSDTAVRELIAWRDGDRTGLDPVVTQRRRVRGLWHALPK
jgi:WD40 repeat protein